MTFGVERNKAAQCILKETPFLMYGPRAARPTGMPQAHKALGQWNVDPSAGAICKLYWRASRKKVVRAMLKEKEIWLDDFGISTMRKRRSCPRGPV